MKAFLFRAMALALVASATPAFAASIFYSGGVATIGSNGPAGGASYTIETDGTLGTLASSNILSYSIMLNPTGASSMTYTGMGASLAGSALSATAQALSFNFANTPAAFQLGTGANYIIFSAGSPNGTIFVQSQGQSSSARGIDPIIAAATVQTARVPEPASWAMMVAGFGFIGSAMRRRKVAVSFA